MATPVVTPVMGIELPIPGETKALGVAPPGQSWMELQNAGFLAFDAHDHTGNGKGLPITSLALDIDADLDFNDFGAVGLKRAAFEAQASTLAAANIQSLYAVANGDLYYNNASGTPVQITSGTGIAGSPGSISGMVSGTSVRYDAPTTSYVFEQASGVVAGVACGPLALTDPTVGGHKINLFAPSGLSADFDWTLPAALPASTMFLTVSSTGALATNVYIDETTLKLAAGEIGVDIDTTSIQYSSGKIRMKPVAAQVSANTPPTAYNSAFPTNITNATVAVTNVAGRPNMVMLQPQPTGLAGIFLENGSAVNSMEVTVELLRNGTVIADFVYRSKPGTGTRADGAPIVFVDTGFTGAGTYTYVLRAYLQPLSTGNFYCQYMNLVGYEM